MDDQSKDSPHWQTCTHRMDSLIMVKEAEQVAVFWDHNKNIYHYSIRVKDWYGCSVVDSLTYAKFTDDPRLEMAYMQEKVRFLESLHR